MIPFLFERSLMLMRGEDPCKLVEKAAGHGSFVCSLPF